MFVMSSRQKQFKNQPLTKKIYYDKIKLDLGEKYE